MRKKGKWGRQFPENASADPHIFRDGTSTWDEGVSEQSEQGEEDDVLPIFRRLVEQGAIEIDDMIPIENIKTYYGQYIKDSPTIEIPVPLKVSMVICIILITLGIMNAYKDCILGLFCGYFALIGCVIAIQYVLFDLFTGNTVTRFTEARNRTIGFFRRSRQEISAYDFVELDELLDESEFDVSDEKSVELFTPQEKEFIKEEFERLRDILLNRSIVVVNK